MKAFNPNTFWDFISTFFNFLNEESKKVIENFWDGLNTASGDMTERANDFVNAQAPQYANTDVNENFYEIQASPLLSLPMKLDPTDINSKTLVTPKNIITVDPSYANNQPIYSDMIEIGADDYYALRDVAIGNYVVIIPKDPSIPTKYFKINNLKSSEEVYLGPRYFPAGGMYPI